MDFTVHVTKIGSTLTFSIEANGSFKYNPTRDNSSSNGVTTTTNEVVTTTWQDNGSNSDVDITIGGYISSSGDMAQKANFVMNLRLLIMLYLNMLRNLRILMLM